MLFQMQSLFRVRRYVVKRMYVGRAGINSRSTLRKSLGWNHANFLVVSFEGDFSVHLLPGTSHGSRVPTYILYTVNLRKGWRCRPELEGGVIISA